jgi:hypothetical protein
MNTKNKQIKTGFISLMALLTLTACNPIEPPDPSKIEAFDWSEYESITVMSGKFAISSHPGILNNNNSQLLKASRNYRTYKEVYEGTEFEFFFYNYTTYEEHQITQADLDDPLNWYEDFGGKVGDWVLNISGTDGKILKASKNGEEVIYENRQAAGYYDIDGTNIYGWDTSYVLDELPDYINDILYSEMSVDKALEYFDLSPLPELDATYSVEFGNTATKLTLGRYGDVSQGDAYQAVLDKNNIVQSIDIKIDEPYSFQSCYSMMVESIQTHNDGDYIIGFPYSDLKATMKFFTNPSDYPLIVG